MISQETIQTVKNASSTYDVVSQFLKLKKQGVDFVGLCPFHDEKTPSFTISPVKNIYKCFGCGANGNGITFLMKHQGKSYIEAVKWIAAQNNITVEEVGAIKKTQKPVPRLETLSKEVIEYFEKRCITNNTLIRFKVTESLEWMPKAQAEVKAVCFNYYRNEQLVNIKFRAKNKDFKMAKDAELIFYNLDAIKNETTCYITEGEIDCMSLYEAGIFNVVSVPNGASATQAAKLEYLDNCFEYFLDKTKIVLVTDNDAAGKRLEEELARRIGFEKCYVVKYSDKCKDANEVLVKYGKEELRNILETAKRYPLYGEITIEDMYETLNDFFFEGYPVGYDCKVSEEFDQHLKFYPGQLTIVTGIPGSGKSEFVDWIMTGLATHHSWNWGVCSFECPPEIHVTKLAEKLTNKAFAFRSNPMHRMTQNEFEKSLVTINSHFHFMNLSLIDITIDGIIAKAEEFVKRYGINGFLFDPWNCIEAKDDTTNYILQCLNKLINFLEKYRVHGFLVAHPTKLKKDLNTKKYVIPNLYDISGSAHFFNRTHNGLSVYRDFETNKVDIYFQKVKWSWLGKLGFCSYDFDKDTRAYKPIMSF